MQHRIKWCYLCRSAENLTSDHIPPKNLFPAPLPTNLITVPCCKSCNEGFSKLDEQFRAFVTAAVNVSDTGKAVMRNKVFGKSYKKSPALKRRMAEGVFKRSVITPFGTASVPFITMDRAILNPFFTRLTKGFLATFYPEVDYFDLKFVVKQINQFGTTHPTFNAITSHFSTDQRGNGVFRFWYVVRPNEGRTGIWIYQFYDAALFQVAHAESEALLTVSEVE